MILRFIDLIEETTYIVNLTNLIKIKFESKYFHPIQPKSIDYQFDQLFGDYGGVHNADHVEV